MLSDIFHSTTIPVLEEVASFAQARHTVLAGNIANTDVPGYKVRELSVDDFQDRLQAAIKQRHEPPRQHWSPGLPESVVSGSRSTDLAHVAEDSKTILRHDKGNVGMEYQVTEMVKNQMQHNMALTVMNQQFRLLKAAISERF